MGKIILIGLLAAASSIAQFQDLATNYDGSVLYFSSRGRLRGTDQVWHDKLFVLDSAGLRLYAGQNFS